MRKNFFKLAFTPAVKAQQSRHGSRIAYARAEEAVAAEPEGGLGAAEIEFLKTRDSFYLASVSETGWPYIQHRGGPRASCMCSTTGRSAGPSIAATGNM